MLELLQLLRVGLQPFLLPGITAAPAPGPPEAAACPGTTGCISWATTTSLPRQPSAETPALPPSHACLAPQCPLLPTPSCWPVSQVSPKKLPALPCPPLPHRPMGQQGDLSSAGPGIRSPAAAGFWSTPPGSGGERWK